MTYCRQRTGYPAEIALKSRTGCHMRFVVAALREKHAVMLRQELHKNRSAKWS